MRSVPAIADQAFEPQHHSHDSQRLA